MDSEFEPNIPIYVQIMNDIKRRIVSEQLKPEDKLHSVREMSVKLKVNPNTIQKAYKSLEEDNYIYTVKGVGNFVKNADELKNLHIKNMKNELYKVIKSLRELGLKDERIIDMVKEILNPSTRGGKDVIDK